MRPVVCFDETSKQVVGHARTPIPPRPGTAARVDDEYTREGTANIFAAIEPVTGKALVQVTERRTSIDTARFFKRLSDEVYAAATTIVLVMDNLSTHSIACLYEAFPPAEARRIARASRSITPPGMAAGSTSPRLSSPPCPSRASISAYPMLRPSERSSMRGCDQGRAARSGGGFVPRTLGSSCIASTHRFRRFEVLVQRRRDRVEQAHGAAPANSPERIRGLGEPQGTRLVHRHLAQRNHRSAMVDGTSTAVH